MKGKLRDELVRNKWWYIAIIIVIVIASILAYFVSQIEAEKGTDLIVDEVYFSPTTDLGGEDSDLKILVFLTNEGKGDIDEVRIRAFAVETDSNLARDEDSVTMGNILGKTTSEGELFISVPNNDSYRIELLVFEDGKLTIRGSGTVDLKGVGTASDYKTSGDDDTSDNDLSYGFGPAESDGSTAFFALCIFLVLPVIIIGIIIYAVVKGQKMRTEKVTEETSEDDEQAPPALKVKGPKAEPFMKPRIERREDDGEGPEEEYSRGPFE